jgi:hypothetical protein
MRSLRPGYPNEDHYSRTEKVTRIEFPVTLLGSADLVVERSGHFRFSPARFTGGRNGRISQYCTGHWLLSAGSLFPL